MLKIVGIMLLGVLTGWVLRRHKLKFTKPLITILIWLLLFVLGLEVGSDGEVMKHLPTLGLKALVIAFFATVVSVLFAYLLWNRVREKEHHER